MSTQAGLAHPELKGGEAWVVDPTWDPVAKQVLEYDPKGDGTYPVVRELLTGLNVVEGDITRVESRDPEVLLGPPRDSPRRVSDCLFEISYTDEHHSTIETAVYIGILRLSERNWGQRLLIHRGVVKRSWRQSSVESFFLHEMVELRVADIGSLEKENC